MRIIFQVAIAVLSLVGIISVVRKKKEHLLGPVGALLWIMLWVGFVSVVSIPSSTQKIADIIGIGRGVDLVMYVSIALLFFLFFKLYIKVESLKRDLVKLARKHTLENIEKK